MYFKMSQFSPQEEELTMKGPTARHTDPEPGCQGFSYGCIVGPESPPGISFFKETWHVNYNYRNQAEISNSVHSGGSIIDGNWHGMKYIRYDLDSSGNPTTNKNDAVAVKLEQWFDDNGDGSGFVRINERIDSGGWGSGGDDCGGDSDQIGLWGNARVLWRMDTNNTNLQFKWMACREIDAGADDSGGGTTPPPVPNPNPPPPSSGGKLDENGIRIPYVMTGISKLVTFESHHENGDRYSTEGWKHENYYAVAYFHTAKKDQVNIEMKTDGPNHGGCTSMPECMWAEPDFQIQTGVSQISSEYPHPDNHPAVSSGFTIVNIPGNYDDQWIGYGVAAYWNSDGYRVYDQWVDVDPFDGAGKPKNGWVRTIHGANTGQLMPNPKRDLPTDFDQGLELEFRCHHGYGTSMKWGNAYEIDPDAVPNSGGAIISERLPYTLVACTTADAAAYGITPLQLTTLVISEELIESQTDPNIGGDLETGIASGWNGVSIDPLEGIREIGDTPCTGVEIYGDGLAVGEYWSNRHNNCIVPGIATTDLGSSTVISNHGGRFLTHPTVNLIFWGSEWNTQTNPSRNDVIVAVRDKLFGTDNQFFDELNQYSSCGLPTYGTAITNTTTAYPGGNIDFSTAHDVLVRSLIIDALNNGDLPLSQATIANQFYIILMRKNTTILDGDVGGFHSIFRANLTDPNAPPPPETETFYIVYAVVKGYALYDSYTDTIGHEIVEACTDVDPNERFGNQAYRDHSVSSQGEISDFCQDGATYPSGLWMQGYWSNSDANCVIPGLVDTDLGTSSLVTTQGGRILTNAKVYLIYWGSDWQTRTAAPTSTELTRRVKDLMLGTNVAYFDKLTQYGSIQRPTWGGVVFNTTTSVPSASEITKAQVEEFVKDSLNNNLVPRPDTDVNSIIYHVVAPVGKEVILGDSTAGGFHDVFRPVLTSLPPTEPPGPTTCPTGSHFDGTVCVPDAPPPPTVTTKLIGQLKLQKDVNLFRTSACAGNTGGGGGGTTGTSAKFYEVVYDDDPDNTRALSDSDTFNHRTRITQLCETNTGRLKGKTIQQLDIPLLKEGTPDSTFFVTAGIWSSSGSVIYTSPTTFDPSTFTSSFVSKTFDFSTNTHAFVVGDRVGIEFIKTSPNHYIRAAFVQGSPIPGTRLNTWEVGHWQEFDDRDLVCTMWE